MQKHQKITKSINWVFASLLAILGFAGSNACIEYGSPYADYTIKGKVVSKPSQKAIEGIRVGYFPDTWLDEHGPLDEFSRIPRTHVFTNAKGEFSLTIDYYFTSPTAFFVEDVDGEKNGLFQSQKIEVDFSKAVHSGKTRRWYEGRYTITVSVALDEIIID